jgi:S1-C subfamily serine protease
MSRWAAVGIGAAMVAMCALALAIPAVRAQDDEAGRRVEVIRFGGGARLGVVLEEVGSADVSRLKLAEERGALVKDVSKGSAAEKAGIKPGDVILSYQGDKVWSAAQLRRLVRETPPGRSIAFEVNRAGSVQRLTATLEEARDRELSFGDDSFRFDVPVPPIPPVPPVPGLDHLLEEGDRGRRFLFRDRRFEGRQGKLGLSYQEVSGQLARYFKVDDGGLLVTDVEAEGPAARGGVRAGDVIVRFNGKATTDADDLRRVVGDAAGGSEVTLTVQREGHPVDLKVTLRDQGRVRAPRSAI